MDSVEHVKNIWYSKNIYEILAQGKTIKHHANAR
jgi:hypothetical protein